MFKPAGELKVVPMEYKFLEWWKERDIFNKLREKNKNGPKWSFLDGPITANNPMGVHHAWGRTYKDIFQRYHAMNGFQTRYQNGFDCQGLWVEVEVEKELGFKSKKDIEAFGVAKFIDLCKERVKKYSAIQSQQSIRLGYWMDWDNSYYTMSDENNYTIWHFLKKCHENGWIYRGVDVMPWCYRCGTALSEHEIVTEGYKEIVHTSVFLRFPLKDKTHESLLVWTTTPWTLTSNVAASVHPEKEYVKVRQGDEYFYLMKARMEILKGKYEVIETFPGEKLVGLEYIGPFDDLPAQKETVHRVIPWKEVTESEGTGIVHTAPGCGKEDFQLSKEFGLSVIAPLDEIGLFTEKFGWLQGKNAHTAAEEIFEDLKKKGILYYLEDYSHRYPTCWRCGKELVFRLVDEWFIRMDQLRYQIMEVTKKIRWLPEYGMERELDWLKNMHDWCISKKRYWGLCLPIYFCKKCENIEVIGGKEELKERAVEGWDVFDGHSPHKPYVDAVKIKCSQCGETVSRIPDVGNPWLDAGIVPFSTMHYLTDHEYWKQWYPADFITECFPGQFRNWFYSLLAMSTVLENHEPFRTILGHALVKDEQGRDMHKSQGNAIWFEEAADKMGVEIMRYIFACQNPFVNLNFGYNLGQETYRELLTYWNCYSFFVTYAGVDGFDPTKVNTDGAECPLIDRWLLSRLNSLVQKCRERMEDFDLASFMRLMKEFIDELSNWYIRTGRRRFWKSENDQDKTLAYITLYTALETLVRLYAPIMPFLSEEMYQNLVRSVDESAPESVHLSAYPQFDQDFIDRDLEASMSDIMDVVRLGRNSRNIAAIKVRQPLSRVFLFHRKDESRRLDERLVHLVKDELNIKELVYVSSESRELIKYLAKPNLALLGRKLRGDAPKVKVVLESLTSDFIADNMVGKPQFDLIVGEKTFTLTAEEVIIEKTSPEHIIVAQDDEWMVALDARITEDLKKEGLIRELVHRIQDLRKEAGYHVADRINLTYSKGCYLSQLMKEFESHIKAEVLALEVLEVEEQTPAVSPALEVGCQKSEVSPALEVGGQKSEVSSTPERQTTETDAIPEGVDIKKELSFDGYAITIALEKVKERV